MNIPAEKELWNGYNAYRFSIDQAECIVVAADSPLKTSPWVWRARYFNANHAYDMEMLRCGFHIAHIDISELSGGADTMEQMNRFYDFLVTEHNFSPMPILEAYSRGAFPALNWGIRNPEKIGLIALDNPICDLESWQKTPQEMEFYRAAGLAGNDNQLLPEWDPLKNLESLVQNRVPMAVMYDPEDPAVSSEENAEQLLQKMALLGGISKGIVQGSQFSGDEIEELVNYTLNHRKTPV